MLNFIAVSGLWALTCYLSYKIGFRTAAMASLSLFAKLLAVDNENEKKPQGD